jgi:PAS domain S-box-containing protein
MVAHSTTVSPGPWHLAVWLPIYSPNRGPTVLVGLIDEVALVRPFAEDASRDLSVRIRAGDTLLLQTGADNANATSFTRVFNIGARQLAMDVAERSRVPRSPLADVVLALGLTVSMLLVTTLWQQRRMWLQAVEESQRFRAVFDTAFQVQLLLDLDGTVLEANRAAGDLAESAPDRLNGVTFWRAPWWNDDDVTMERVQERFERARAGETQRFEVDVGRAKDRSVTVDFSLKPLLDASQRVTRVIAEGRDLTIRKRAEESMREISALTTMGQLAARVAHEINNPLAGIQNAFLLIRGAIPETHPHYRFVGAIEREIARIAAVTRQLYETYRPDQLMAKQSSVILAVSDAVSFLEQVNRGRQVQIVTDMSRAPSMVPVPDALLRQTLYNLVQNAVDVSPADGTVHVSAAEEGDCCVLRVTDEGPGVPPAIRERIFDPFFSTKDRTMKTGGMGIGLALVRQSVQAVGGQISLHDRPGGGTEFEVRLPMTPLDTGVLR